MLITSPLIKQALQNTTSFSMNNFSNLYYKHTRAEPSPTNVVTAREGLTLLLLMNAVLKSLHQRHLLSHTTLAPLENEFKAPYSLALVLTQNTTLAVLIMLYLGTVHLFLR